MGTYVNPGNSGFSLVLRGEYVDKTEMITLLNQSIDTPRMLTCVSRPRRFGKSYAAKMLCAYYDCSCDSHALFDGRAVSRTEGYEDYMNQFNVISLDITSFVSRAKRMGEPLRDVTNYIVEAVREDLIELDPSLSSEKDLINCLLRNVDGRGQGRKFIFVIDEWDALIREAVNDTEAQERFFNLLRELFKNNSFTPRGVAAAYITGILPIKKDGSQSAISDFIEYPILYPGAFARFTGFTEEEVRALCQKHEMDFSQMKAWYDGYDFAGTGSIYNPYSVISAVCNREYRSYWQKTSAIESLPTYIRLNYDGLQEIVARLITGEEIETDPDTFENDFVSFKNRDDVLTLLVHLGYLTWNKEEGTVRIPNEEVRIEFKKMLRDRSRSGTGDILHY